MKPIRYAFLAGWLFLGLAAYADDLPRARAGFPLPGACLAATREAPRAARLDGAPFPRTLTCCDAQSSCERRSSSDAPSPC